MFFKPTYLYIKVRKNAVWVKQLETQKVVDLIAPEPFTTTRLLVGQLTVARQTIRSAIAQVYSNRRLLLSPKILIQPLEYIEGGLSEVEKRTLLELFAVSIPFTSEDNNVVIWVGKELTDIQVKEKFIELAHRRRTGDAR